MYTKTASLNGWVAWVGEADQPPSPFVFFFQTVFYLKTLFVTVIRIIVQFGLKNKLSKQFRKNLHTVYTEINKIYGSAH